MLEAERVPAQDDDTKDSKAVCEKTAGSENENPAVEPTHDDIDL